VAHAILEQYADTCCAALCSAVAQRGDKRGVWCWCCAGDHARVSDIVSEVEQRDLREATARLQQAAAGGSRVLPSDEESSSDSEDCSSCYVEERYDDTEQRPRRSSAFDDH